MTIMHEGVTSRFAQIKNETLGDDRRRLRTEREQEFKIKNEELKEGINQVTIFDEEGRVWADRLFFVTKPELTKPTISISGLKAEYQPFEEIDLTLTLSKGEGIHPFPMGERDGERGFSLSVRDAVRQDNTFDSGNIMTEMLLASEIKGFVPQPEWFFEKDDKEHRRALDLLMMTQGWRRFSWREMALPGAWEITHPAEQSQMVTGTVNEYEISLSREMLEPASYIERLNMMEFPSENAPRPETNFQFIRDKFNNQKKLKKEVRVHAEIIKPDAPKNSQSTMITDITTEQGTFKLELPNFYGDCLLFVTAKDTTLWDKKLRKIWLKKFRDHNWIQMEDDEYERLRVDAEFYVQLQFPHPRWVKPYTYYQNNIALPRDTNDDYRLTTDKTHILDEVTIRSRRNGLRRIDLSKPVYVVDAYEAGNFAMDAGLLTDLYALKEPPHIDGRKPVLSAMGYGNTGEIALGIISNYIGDMNMERRYKTAIYWDSIRVAGDGVTNYPLLDNSEQRRYSRLEYIDKIYLYTDYSPREEGSERYNQDDQPSVEVSLHKYPDNSRRVTYRDRRYVLHGFAYQEDFYHPDYKRNPPKEGQKDYRRTLYWNPDLKLDENGEAHVTLYNNSRRTQIKVEANGMTSEGGFLYNK